MRIYMALLGVLFTTALSGCAEGPPAGTAPDMTFAHLQPLQINAARIEVVDNYKPPMKDPNVEHTFRTPPYVAAETLLKKQLVAAGGENTLRAIIEDASVVREELPATNAVMGLLTREPSERLKGKVLVRFELVSPQAPDIVLGHAEVTVKREKTLAEGISPVDREFAYFLLTEDLMDNLNQGMKTIVVGTFGKKS